MRRIRPGQWHWQQDSEGGAAVVEFALVIPALLLIICGIFVYKLRVSCSINKLDSFNGIS
jgi:hypothetical protein